MNMNKSIVLLLCGLIFFVPKNVMAWGNSRDYISLPPGMFFLALYNNQAFGEDLYSKGDKVSNSADLKSNVTVIRTVAYTELFGMAADWQVVLPVGKVSLLDDESSGIGDLTLLGTIWLIDNKEDSYYLGYTPYVTLPLGEYDREKIVNLGSNRYSTKHEFGAGIGSGAGLWWEVVSSFEVFFDNDDVSMGTSEVTSSKDILFYAESHLSYNFTKEFIGSLDYYFTYGGETDLDGTKLDDGLNNHAIGISGSYMITPKVQFLLNVKKDVSIRNGVDTSTVESRLAFIF